MPHPLRRPPLTTANRLWLWIPECDLLEVPWGPSNSCWSWPISTHFWVQLNLSSNGAGMLWSSLAWCECRVTLKFHWAFLLHSLPSTHQLAGVFPWCVPGPSRGDCRLEPLFADSQMLPPLLQLWSPGLPGWLPTSLRAALCPILKELDS